MNTKNTLRSCVLVLLAATVLAPASGPAWAKKEKREPIESYRARTFDIQRGRAANLDIVIYEWTTPEERQALLKTFIDKGSDALYDALQKVERKGYFRLPQTVGYDIQYAWQMEVEGKRRLVLATDRPMGFIELSRGLRSTDYNVSLVILDLDPATGEGSGTAMGGVELSIDKETNVLNIEHATTQPSRITNVKKLKIKKKSE